MFKNSLLPIHTATASARLVSKLPSGVSASFQVSRGFHARNFKGGVPYVKREKMETRNGVLSNWYRKQIEAMHQVFQPGFGYQQQLVPGMRPGAGSMPNFLVPMVQQGQQAQQPGGRCAGGGLVQQSQQPAQLMQHQ